MRENKSEKIDYRATREDVKRLNELAKKVSRAEVLRELVNREYEANKKKEKKT